MKILVIGGSGFIGSHLVDELMAKGHAVTVYDRSLERFRATPQGVTFVQGDFGDGPRMAEALADCDAVMHVLSTTVPGTSNLDPVADIEGNLVNTVRLLEAMRGSSVAKLVFLSSGGTVYGIPETDPVSEDHPLRPISSYGIVKTAIERYLHMEHHLHGLQYIVLRASNPYGPRQGGAGIQGVIGTYLANIAQNQPIHLWGDGEIVRDFIYIDDLVDLCVKAVQSDAQGIFNAGKGDGHSIREIIATISDVVGRQIEPVVEPGRQFDVPRIVLDIAKARETFDWSPETALRDGIAANWRWMQGQGQG